MRKKKKELKLKSRREIFDFIKNNPGLNLREISRKTNIPKTTLNYHIRYMLKLEIIEIKSEGKYKLIYPKDKVGKNDKKILQLLRQEIPCLIFLHFLHITFFSQKDLCRELGISSSTANYHLKKFLDMDILEKTKSIKGRIFPFKEADKTDVFFERKHIGREIIFVRKNQEIIDDAWRILITFKESLPNKKLIDNYMDFFEEWSYYQNYLKQDKIKLSKNRGKEDKFLNQLLDLFKQPFAY